MRSGGYAVAVWIMLVLSGSLVLAQPDCSAGHLGGTIGNRRMPRVVGCSFDAVRQVFQDYGVTALQNAVSSGAPRGQITGQDTPVEAVVQPKGTVRLTVSSGPFVPNAYAHVLVPPYVPQPSGTDLNVISTTPPNKGRLPGDAVTLSFRVINEGPGSTRQVTIWQQSVQNLDVQGLTGECSKFPCVIPLMTAGQTVNFNVNGVVSGDGDYGLGVHVSGSVTDLVTDNNNAYAGGTARTPFARQSDLALTGTMSPGEYRAGQTVTFSLTVTNAGQGPADGFQLIDELTNLKRQSVTGAGCVTMPCGYPSRLGPGATTQFSVTDTVVAAGNFRAVLSVVGDGTDHPSKSKSRVFAGTAPNVARPFVGAPVLELTLDAVPAPPYRVGQTVDLALNVLNEGKGTRAAAMARNITLSQTSIEHLALAGVSGDCVNTTTTMRCSLASLKAGASRTVHVQERITQPGPFYAEFLVSEVSLERNTVNNTASFQGRTPNGPPVWVWVVAAVALLSVLGGGLHARMRREWWPTHTRVSAEVDLAEASHAVLAGLPFKLPPVSVSVRLERGTAEPDGPIHIEREVIKNE